MSSRSTWRFGGSGSVCRNPPFRFRHRAVGHPDRAIFTVGDQIYIVTKVDPEMPECTRETTSERPIPSCALAMTARRQTHPLAKTTPDLPSTITVITATPTETRTPSITLWSYVSERPRDGGGRRRQ